MPWVLIAGAGAYGAVVGALLPRAVYRLSVEPEEPWREVCPDGHAYAEQGRVRAWVGPARCEAERGGYGERAGGDGHAGAHGSGGGALAVTGALVSAGLAAAVGASPELAVWLLMVPFGLLLSVVDRRVNRLPDVLTLPLAVGAIALLGLAALLPGAEGSWARAWMGGIVLSGAYFVLFVISPRAVGFGDVKLALALGVALGWYGWDVLFAGAFLGFLVGAVYGVALILARRAGRRTALAFGPFMVLGALAGVALGGLAA
ncbi:prepilin peptidase [Streptomyces sp. NPDC048172]|uniref:prepilin peptidase n=1 Tax=Streptomyces sp. NPDC048172 TaxID=3365505 RepID=UPI003722918F